MEALWPEDPDHAAVKNRFRVTLASLRKQLEPEGFPFGSVLDPSVPGCVRLRPGSTWCDLVAFEQLLAQGDRDGAAALLTGPLLPGVYDEWAHDAQIRYELLRSEWAEEGVAQLRISHSAEPTGHRLPLFLSRFFGRSHELSMLAELLDHERLVTIVGPGGVGKTRLSVEACRSSSIRSVFVPLEDCTDSDSTIETVLRHLTGASQTTTGASEQLLEVLQRLGEIRLILDNAEHITDAVSEVVELLLSRAPDLRCLVSSRQPLELMGEQVLRLEPFDASSIGDSIRVFVDRVRQSRPDFAVSPATEPAIEAICRALDGLPLAIELAAAQITVMGVPDILKRVESSLLDIRSKKRTISPRHQSLRAVIETSFAGLTPDQATFLGRVSVFVGGFTASAAQAIATDQHAVEHLSELTSRSLLGSKLEGEAVRFSCLEPIRQLAQEAMSPSSLPDVRRAHATYFFQIASQVDEDDLLTLEPLDQEYTNLAAAFQSASLSQELFWDGSRGAIMHAFIRGQHRTALRWIRAFGPQLMQCTNYGIRQAWRAAALQVLPDMGCLEEAARMTDDYEREAVAEHDAWGQAFALIVHGLILSRGGDTLGSLEPHRKAMDAAERIGDHRLLEAALSHLSGTLHEVWRVNHDPVLLSESELCARRLIDLVSPMSRRYPLARLLAGVALYYQERWDEASTMLAEAAESASRLNIRSVGMYAAYFEAKRAEQRGDALLADEKWARFRELSELTGIRFDGD